MLCLCGEDMESHIGKFYNLSLWLFFYLNFDEKGCDRMGHIDYALMDYLILLVEGSSK